MIQLKQKYEIFEIDFDFFYEITNELMIKVYILIDKYYKNYKLKSKDITEEDNYYNWYDIVVFNNVLPIKDLAMVDLKCPFYISTDEDDLKQIYIENGIHIFYGYDEDDGYGIGIDILASVFTNINYEWIGVGEDGHQKYKRSDQSKAAKKNREILKSFLMELDKLLKAESVDFASTYLDERYIYKYGIKNDAVLKGYK